MSFFEWCTLRRLLAELTLLMSGLPSLRIRIPSALRIGFVRVFLPADDAAAAPPSPPSSA